MAEPTPLKPLEAGLYVVSTPIGNLRDITLRALDVLARADVVLAEDTRVCGKLLSAHGVKNRVERYDDHTGERARPQILERLALGQRIALTTDAGTPLVSDPGFRLVQEAARAGLPVFPVPGASAALAALTAAGLPTDRFLFAGFSPHKSGPRRSFLESLKGVQATLVLYESGPRLADSLADMAAVFGPREAAVCRELTKLHETTYRGTLDTLAADPRLDGPRGEIVVVIGPPLEAAAAMPEAVDAALTDALLSMGPAEAASQVSRLLDQPRKALYRRALELKGAV
ncbi:16S rRNA (cytidine(1402)-2'-O)-methyltransferase [soil metagenome]